MNSPLFNLISKAGSASLGELNARSSFVPNTLALEIVKMLRNGDVTLSFDADSKPQDVPAMEIAAFREAAAQSPALGQVIGLIETPKKLVDLAETDSKLFVEGIEFALNDDRAARAINVNPTSKGFRFSVA
jgi:hypothetical protein